MPTAKIHIVKIEDGEANEWPWPDVDREAMIHDTEPWDVCILEAGMSSGKPSVALRFNLPDGKVLVSETSLAMLIAVMAGARGAFPAEFVGGPFAVS